MSTLEALQDSADREIAKADMAMKILAALEPVAAAHSATFNEAWVRGDRDFDYFEAQTELLNDAVVRATDLVEHHLGWTRSYEAQAERHLEKLAAAKASVIAALTPAVLR